MINNFRISPIFLLTLTLVCAQISAQEITPPTEEAPELPADKLNRQTPLRSGDGFLTVADKGDFETAAEYLDLRNLRGEARELTGEQLARRFDVIIKRAKWVDIDELSDTRDGRKNDGLPAYRDSIGVVLDEGKEVRLFMQKVPRDDGVSIWKVSNATVSLIPELYDTYGYSRPVENLRRKLPNVMFLGIELFKWIIVLTVGLGVYAAVFLLALLIRRIFRDPGTPSHRLIFRFVAIPFALWATVLAMTSVADTLGRGQMAEMLSEVTPIPILLTVWVLFAGMNLIRDIYAARLKEQGRTGAAVLLRPASSAIKMLIAVGALLIYLDNLGINITTVLAGLGVGGVAVALALQKPMEDVFGALTLYTQQPIRVGDFCRVGTETGTIEEISLRTTRIRTLANTLIAIPNAQLANEPIDNISARGKILFRPTLRLRHDITPEQLQQILEGIRNLLGAHEQVLQDNWRVRFKEIADDALLVEVYAYLNTTVWADYLEMAEDLNIRILKIVADAGTRLSLPANTIHVEQNTLGNTDRA